MSAPLVEARDVVKRFARARGGRAALDGVSIAVARGAFVALTGPSGGGKTTLLAVLGALERPTSGAVVLDGHDLVAASDAERSRLRRRVGFVFQSAPMLRRLPVWENVTCGLVPLGEPPGVRRERARAVLARLGLEPFLDVRPETLSGGEAQRVALARALVAGPPLLLADEPTSHLDRASADAVAGLLREAHAGGAAVVVATHDPRLIEAAAEVHEVEAGRLRRRA